MNDVKLWISAVHDNISDQPSTSKTSSIMRLYIALLAVILLPLAIAESPTTSVQNGFDNLPASAEIFTTFANKGGALICALEGSDRTAGHLLKDTRDPPSAASKWTGDLKQEMSAWYWHDTWLFPATCDFDSYWHLGATMRGLGLNPQPPPYGDNDCYQVEHWDSKRSGDDGLPLPAIMQWYKVDGKDYQATKARFQFAINRKGGAIFGLDLLGPKEAASHLWYQGGIDPDLAALPQLRALSDILWGYWVRDNPNVRNIRYFLMIGIANKQTNELIASCLQRSRKELSQWPGAEFSTATDEGRAILASPNGAAFAYFLLQHKTQLGRKTISKVTVLIPDDNNKTLKEAFATLVFHVEDVAEAPPDEGAIGHSRRRSKEAAEVTKLNAKTFLRVHTFEV